MHIVDSISVFSHKVYRFMPVLIPQHYKKTLEAVRSLILEDQIIIVALS